MVDSGVFVPPISAASYTAHGPYNGKTLEGLRNGKGKYRFSNSFYEYDGEWSGGVMHGEGVMRMKDGSGYEGQFERNAMSGVGMRTWPDGATFSGQFAAGEMHGEGTYISAAGEQYEGTMVRNLREGGGVLHTAGGDRYEGAFAKHRMSGQGVMAYADGGVYDGEWERSVRSGTGNMTWGGGDTYEGAWSEDLMNGEGAFEHPSGYSRMGEWLGGQPASVATRIELCAWVPPPSEVTVSAVVTPVAAMPVPVEGGEEGEGDAAVAAPLPLESLTLRLTVVLPDAEGAPVSTATLVSTEPLPTLDAITAEDEAAEAAEAAEAGEAPAEAAASVGACTVAAPLVLSVPEGAARPLTLTVELVDGDGTIVLCCTSLPLALDATGATAGSLSGVALLPPGAAEADPTVASATLSIEYSAVEAVETLNTVGAVEGTTEEALAVIMPAEVMVGEQLHAFAGVCVREIEREIDPDAPPPEPAPVDPKAKKGKEPEPEPEPAGPIFDFFPVSCENGRAFSLTLKLPEEAVEKRAADAQAASEEALAAWEAEQAAAAEAHAAAVAEAETNGTDAPEQPDEGTPPEALPPPPSEWFLGTVTTADGRLLARGLVVPTECPSGPATLVLVETTPPLGAPWELPMMAAVEFPVTLKPIPGTEPEPEPEPEKGKKKK